MCQKCKDATEAAALVVGRDAAEYMLWNETAFPFCDGDETARQLAEAVDRMVVMRAAAAGTATSEATPC